MKLHHVCATVYFSIMIGNNIKIKTLIQPPHYFNYTACSKYFLQCVIWTNVGNLNFLNIL